MRYINTPAFKRNGREKLFAADEQHCAEEQQIAVVLTVCNERIRGRRESPERINHLSLWASHASVLVRHCL